MGFTDSPLCRQWRVDDGRCEALGSLRHAHLGSFLEPEDITWGRLVLQKGGRAPVGEVMGHKGPVSFVGVGASGLKGPTPLTNLI
jgi:hypothetical protein